MTFWMAFHDGIPMFDCVGKTRYGAENMVILSLGRQYFLNNRDKFDFKRVKLEVLV